MNINKILYTILIITLSFMIMNCSTTKENKSIKESEVPPGHAQITGVITNIEPVSSTSGSNDPCSVAPCVAYVKVSSAQYGSAFPSFKNNEQVKIKFVFTLEKTSKELFPDMEEEYPGLDVGQEFNALVAYVENINENELKFQIYGYETD